MRWFIAFLTSISTNLLKLFPDIKHAVLQAKDFIDNT